MSYLIYIIAAVLWGTFATRMHIKLFRKNKAISCFILNGVFWPIAMIVAIIKCPLEEIIWGGAIDNAVIADICIRKKIWSISIFSMLVVFLTIKVLKEKE